MPAPKLVLTAAAVTALALGVAAPTLAQEPMPGGPGAQPTQPATTPAPSPSPGPGTLTPAPAPPAPVPQVPGPLGKVGVVPVNEAKLVDGIKTRVASAVGSQFVITRNGQVVASVADGDARRAVDGQMDMTTSSRIEVMSVTKHVTAITLLRWLDIRNFDVDRPISDVLPPKWTKAGGFAADAANPITFRHLLTHTSGINQAMTAAPASAGLGNGWDGLKSLVAYGATPNAAAGNYKNANYALMRVLIPRLSGEKKPTEATAYKDYLTEVNRVVFKPAGVAKVSCHAVDDSSAALVYDTTVPGGTGLLPERQDDDAADCGGHIGLHLSSTDLARVGAYLRHTEKLLSADVRQTMSDGRLGWNAGSNNGGGRTDTKGVWWHGGDGTWSGRQVHSCVMAMPQGYSASLIVNSQPASACGVLLNAYKDSVK